VGSKQRRDMPPSCASSSPVAAVKLKTRLHELEASHRWVWFVPHPRQGFFPI